MKLSENFSLQELTKSQTAERKGIDNTPSAEHQENLKSLCTSILQPVRDHFGRVVTISSGYRSPELCTAIGSKITSQHAKGEAADFEIFGVSNKELADYIDSDLQLRSTYSRVLERIRSELGVGALQLFSKSKKKTVFKSLPKSTAPPKIVGTNAM